MRLSIIISLTILATACGTADLRMEPPAALTAMHQVDGADVTSSFPGYDGPVFALGGDLGAHWFGVLTRTTGKGPQHLLVGISPHRVWSEPITLEAADREVLSVELVAAWLGDLQKDGAPDLLLHLRATSRQVESGRGHVRDVVHLYSLGKDLRQAWLETIALKGTSLSGCRRSQYDYRARTDWMQDKSGGVRSMEVSARTILETCAPTMAECKGPVVCGMERSEDTEAFIWDPDLGAFRAEDSNEARFTVPDVSF